MNHQQTLDCLQDPEKLKQFIAKLKNDDGKTLRSQMFSHVLKLFHMHKSPRGIFINDFLQHTFTFCDPIECFQVFRLVSKPWKNVIESQKFYNSDGYKIFRKLFSQNFPKNIPIIYEKIFKSLKQIRLGDHISDSRIVDCILKNMKNLHKIKIDTCNFPDLYKPLILQLIKNSHKYLQKLEIPKLFIPNVSLQNLTHIKIQIDKNSDVNQFGHQFNQILKNAEHLKIFEIVMIWDNFEICDYISQNFSNHCTIGTEVEYFKPPRYLPVKSARDRCLSMCVSWKFFHVLEYLKLEIQPDLPYIWGWRNAFEDFLQNCVNLKGIFFEIYPESKPMKREDFYEKENENIFSGRENMLIWQKRISILNSQGIQILNQNAFTRKEIQISQNVPWRFKFG